MNVVAIKKHRYRGEVKLVGDKYEINSKSISLLYNALGWAVEVPPELKPIVNVPLPQNETLPKQTLSQTGLSAKQNKPKGKYKRKDLRAEE